MQGHPACRINGHNCSHMTVRVRVNTEMHFDGSIAITPSQSFHGMNRRVNLKAANTCIHIHVHAGLTAMKSHYATFHERERIEIAPRFYAERC